MTDKIFQLRIQHRKFRTVGTIRQWLWVTRENFNCHNSTLSTPNTDKSTSQETQQVESNDFTIDFFNDNDKLEQKFSVLQVVFLLQRHTGYFLIQARIELSANYSNGSNKKRIISHFRFMFPAL